MMLRRRAVGNLLDDDGLFRTRLGRLAYPLLLVGWYDFRNGRRATVDVAELEHVWCDHGAQRVPLAAVWIHPNLHDLSFRKSLIVAASDGPLGEASCRQDLAPTTHARANI